MHQILKNLTIWHLKGVNSFMFDKPMQESLNFWDSERGGSGPPRPPLSGSAYGLWWNLTGNKNIQSLLQVIFSGPTRKQRRMPLIYLHWFNVSSAASRNVMIFDSKQVLFRADVLTKVENGHLITYRARNYNCQRNHISPHFTMNVFSILKQNLIISLNFWSCGWKIYILEFTG